jgi:hypothetical protein
MTLRELVEDVVGFDDPLATVMGAFQVLRTAIQGEAATFEGCLASLNKFVESYGEPTRENVTRWLDDLGELADVDIPDRVVDEAINVNVEE